jgi:hypothetical protein
MHGGPAVARETVALLQNAARPPPPQGQFGGNGTFRSLATLPALFPFAGATSPTPWHLSSIGCRGRRESNLWSPGPPLPPWWLQVAVPQPLRAARHTHDRTKCPRHTPRVQAAGPVPLPCHLIGRGGGDGGMAV